MQKNIARSLAIGSLMLALGLTSFSLVASAKTTKTTKVKTTHVAKTKVVKVKKVKVAKGHVRTLPGKVVSVTGTTLVMTKGNVTYTIETTGVTPVNRKGATIALTDIKAGNQVSVRGTVTGTVVTKILKLRDITLPVGTTSKTTKK
jgi:hypothetical protein